MCVCVCVDTRTSLSARVNGNAASRKQTSFSHLAALARWTLLASVEPSRGPGQPGVVLEVERNEEQKVQWTRFLIRVSLEDPGGLRHAAVALS